MTPRKPLVTLAVIAAHMVGLRMIDCQTELQKIAEILIKEGYLETNEEGYFRRAAWLRE
jgi:hypothetical protein